MRRCPRCGAEMPEGVHICPNCGWVEQSTPFPKIAAVLLAVLVALPLGFMGSCTLLLSLDGAQRREAGLGVAISVAFLVAGAFAAYVALRLWRRK